MTNVDPRDTYSVPGASIGAQSLDKMESKAIIWIPESGKTLGQAADRVISAANWHVSTFSNDGPAPKYPSNPEVSYYANGSISMLGRLGQLVINRSTNENERPALRIDQFSSKLYSTSDKTTLGSLNIDTVDGHMLNPLCPIYPSTNYSPTRPWYKKLFPAFAVEDLMFLALMEGIQFALLTALADDPQYKQEVITRKSISDIVIEDNQAIEDRLFRNLPQI